MSLKKVLRCFRNVKVSKPVSNLPSLTLQYSFEDLADYDNLY